MLPRFDDDGRLPPGVHAATLAEVEARFGRRSELRRAQFESLRCMIELAKRAGVRRVVLNGLPSLDMSLVDDADFHFYVNRLYAMDRTGEPKGMIEVVP